MRIKNLLNVSLLAALVALPTGARAQSISVSFGTRLGPEVGIFSYSPEHQGNWRNNYRQWSQVTLYEVNGRYYRRQVRGARAVRVYYYNNQYFWPPQDKGWSGADRRYNYRQQPTQQDYSRGRPYSGGGVAIDVRLGNEIGVLGYSQDRAGDWRTNSRRWTPVTLYEFNGHYYPNNAAGARPVAMYRYGNEYFLPPTDQGWVGSDKRFDYNHQPNNDDRGRVRDHP